MSTKPASPRKKPLFMAQKPSNLPTQIPEDPLISSHIDTKAKGSSVKSSLQSGPIHRAEESYSSEDDVYYFVDKDYIAPLVIYFRPEQTFIVFAGSAVFDYTPSIKEIFTKAGARSFGRRTF